VMHAKLHVPLHELNLSRQLDLHLSTPASPPSASQSLRHVLSVAVQASRHVERSLRHRVGADTHCGVASAVAVVAGGPGVGGVVVVVGVGAAWSLLASASGPASARKPSNIPKSWRHATSANGVSAIPTTSART